MLTVNGFHGEPWTAVVPATIIKRDGRRVAFDPDRIKRALGLCFTNLGRTPNTPLDDLTQRVVNIVAAKPAVPTVEQVQDVVETVLQSVGEYEAAKHYILYRSERSKLRQARPVPDSVRQVFAESERYFPTSLQQFQFYDKYSRFSYEHMRRETWVETVDRSVDFLRELSRSILPEETYGDIRQAILNMEAMPSMRLLAMAGPAARRNNLAIYNCSYMPVDSIDAFVEALIISMAGCGVGYSVERNYIEKFPRIRRQRQTQPIPFVVPDSSEGWAEALRVGIEMWFEGGDVEFDYSLVRPAGALLMTKGGRASGPEPLRRTMAFVRAKILARQGSFLRSIDAHDIMCSVGNAAVSGGVRRTAMISLFDFDDQDMLHCKNGSNLVNNEQRWNANNSAVWPNRTLSQAEVARYILDMVESGTGEPGIFSRSAAIATMPRRRQVAEFGTNPCLTGDTWVAVADGRGRARLIDLAHEGKDIDVFTVKDGELVIRKMRNPRKTGTNTPVYRVAFADGSSIRATLNHRFVMLDGSEKTTAELQPNDALMAMTAYSYKKKGLPRTAKCDYDAPHSYRMVQFGTQRKSEHRRIYAHHTGDNIEGIERHIHHKDFDGRNNHISNLQMMTDVEHAREHRDRMLGADNPAVRLMNDTWRKNLSAACAGAINGNAKDISNEQLEQGIIDASRSLGRAMLRKEYIDFASSNGWPLTWQNYRSNYFGKDMQGALDRLASSVGLPVMKRWEIMARKVTDLPLRFSRGRTWVRKECEVCGSTFWATLARREQATCSSSCGNKLNLRLHGNAKRKLAARRAFDSRMASVRDLQVKAYNDLLIELNRHPSKAEWQNRCRRAGVSPEISRKSSPFRYWSDLELAAGATNHRVVSVEPAGFEDVYTGTVDETHTFFSIGGERRDAKGRADMGYVLSENCGEIVLRPLELCNLSIAVARADDTFDSLADKVEIATIIGTIQSMATHFPGLRPEWKQNCEEERLLGVDINGQMDSAVARDPIIQGRLKQVAVETNHKFAGLLGINQSASITCVKPSGNSSQLLDCSSGVHARWAPYYIRNVRVGAHTPIFKILKESGVPMDPENGQTPESANTWVAHFPVKAPAGAITRNDLTARQQCDYWLRSKMHWTEHNPSCTITYKPDEVFDIITWVWAYQDVIGGLTFLPDSDAQYSQMPYEEVSQEQYEQLAAAFPVIDFAKLYRYEMEDYTTAAQELACFAGSCEIPARASIGG